jgi:hypothetical protein
MELEVYVVTRTHTRLMGTPSEQSRVSRHWMDWSRTLRLAAGFHAHELQRSIWLMPRRLLSLSLNQARFSPTPTFDG